MAGTRIDAAHVLGDGPAALDRRSTHSGSCFPVEESAGGERPPATAPPRRPWPLKRSRQRRPSPLPEASALVWTEDLLSRLRVQGRQLAERLRERQRELDSRAAQGHAQTAELENEVRAARLWWIERQQELADREAQLADRASRLSAAEAYHESSHQELTAALQRREEPLARREQDVAAESARVERQTAALIDARKREVEAASPARTSVARRTAAAARTTSPGNARHDSPCGWSAWNKDGSRSKSRPPLTKRDRQANAARAARAKPRISSVTPASCN